MKGFKKFVYKYYQLIISGSLLLLIIVLSIISYYSDKKQDQEYINNLEAKITQLEESIKDKSEDLNNKISNNVDQILDLEGNLGDLGDANNQLKKDNLSIKDSLESVSSELDSVNTNIANTFQSEADIAPDIVKSIVLIYSLDRFGEPVASGSGTVVTPQGHILTNNHVLVDTFDTPYQEFVICTTLEESADPDCSSTAIVVNRDSELDLALLKFDKIYDESTDTLKNFPGNTTFVYREIDENRAKDLRLNDTLFALGYPAAGAGSITFTRGVYSGPIDDLFYKTDVNISPGNSGGFVFTPSSQFAGVPTRVSTQASIGYIVKPDVAYQFVKDSGTGFY